MYFNYVNKIAYFTIFILLANINLFSQTNPTNPNILLILADDLGVDAISGYQNNPLQPVTPHLDSLRKAGVAFRNVWANPQCTPTRASIMTGTYGQHTGVTDVPGNVDPSHTSLFSALATNQNDLYSGAVIGKWHISSPADETHPAQLGVDHYEGSFSGSVMPSYSQWTKTTGGLDNARSSETINEYATTHFTDDAIDWIDQQNQPWFLWLAHVAPHTPFHTPPDPTTYSQNPINSNQTRFIAMIEAMDFEIGRLLDNIDPAVLANTTIIFVGDNGTANQVIQNNFQDGKGSIYQGGVHVPLFACGAKVTRQNEWDESLINVTDIYSTVLELAGTDLDGGVNNSFSFLPQLQSDSPAERNYNFTINDGANPARVGHTIRNDRYKLLKFDDGHDEFYDLQTDSLEMVDLINDVTLSTIIAELQQEAAQILNNWSCQDMIQNGNETGIDCGTATCGFCPGMVPSFPDCNEVTIDICDDIVVDSFVIADAKIIDSHAVTSDLAYFQAEDCILLEAGFSFDGGEFQAVIDDCDFDGIEDTACPTFNDLNFDNIGCTISPTFPSNYAETINGTIREISTNNYPNHNHDANMAANVPSPMDYDFEVDKDPTIAATTTSILNNNNRPRYFFGVALNGVIFAPAPAAPFIFTNTNTGEFNFDWIFEPTNNSGVGQQWVGLDCAAAHTGPQGYHYHGNMIQYLETIIPGSTTATIAPTDPIHIGWAADGFPILYRFGPDENGSLALLQPSFRLKPGLRLGDGVTAPCGSYNGKYTVDYEYISCLGDLDECNGVNRQVTIPTIEGNITFDYFYVITDSFPQISRCFSGTPDQSFR